MMSLLLLNLILAKIENGMHLCSSYGYTYVCMDVHIKLMCMLTMNVHMTHTCSDIVTSYLKLFKTWYLSLCIHIAATGV